MNALRTRAAAATFALAAALLALSGAAQAALVDRGGGLVFDSTRNLTWLADMNYAGTSRHTGPGVNASNGQMTWDAANAWADNLVFGGYSDWRLPTLNPQDTNCSVNYVPFDGAPRQYGGANCTGGELSGLFVTELGFNRDGTARITSDDSDEQKANLALFKNLLNKGYWSSTVYLPGLFLDAAWFFDTRIGSQDWDARSVPLNAVAVRAGDVPEPRTLTLMLLALGATVVVRMCRPA
ncbi:DUF1566 domain-containing protein [Methyloversatilis sp. XJ19-49]|uniref:DUF1566 domain-containing protein n=1 Tax=Methyloversatilis sp. XJ19-49 TaxID=2963429 RepID=UPI00211D0184|nr:DUF1566 domain-containing protein [Methyloversatilis sp. XJ19-49]MCQ9379681.1 DUF1566 domain-containing protein [Methyloversatilis sp. XJ19-49]